MPFADIIGHATPIGWLQQAIQSNHLAHAYLFIGEDGIGKRLTAIRVAQAINCDQRSESMIPDPCGECRSCRQIEAFTFPDFLFIQPDPEGLNPQIKIERIREIEHHVIYRPLIGLRKICLIDEVDRLSVGAANALLKTLEEPPDHCLFLLITSRPSSLLPTITSRCLTIRFSPPSRADVREYLLREKNLSESDARLISILSGGRLGQALQIDLTDTRAQKEKFLAILSGKPLDAIHDMLDTAEGLSKAGEGQTALIWFWPILRDLLLVTLNCDPQNVINEEDIQTLQAIAKRTSISALLNLLEELHSLEQGLHRNLNVQLGFERFLLHLRDAVPSDSIRASVG